MDLRKKSVWVITVLAVFLMCAFPFADAEAAGDTASLKIEQTHITMPEVDVYLYPTDTTGSTNYGMTLANTDVVATLDSMDLEVSSLTNIKEEGTAYVFLLDNSVYTNNEARQAFRDCLRQWYKDQGDKDSMILFTYSNTVTQVLNGTETEETMSAAVGKIGQGGNGDKCYSAVDQALSLIKKMDAPTDPQRKVIIAIDSGALVNGTEAMQKDMIQSLNDASVPLYILFNNTNTAGQQLAETLAADSNGSSEVFTRFTSQSVMADLHARLNSCYHLSAAANSNRIDPVQRTLCVQMTRSGQTYRNSAVVTLKDWHPDNTAPSVEFLGVYDDVTLEFEISEPVTGGEMLDNYTLKDEERDVVLPLTNVYYNVDAGKIMLTAEEELYNGSYILEVRNVRDISQEENLLVCADGNALRFEVTTLKDRGASIEFSEWLIIGVAVLIVGLAVCAFLIYRKRKQDDVRKEQEEEARHRQLQDEMRRQQQAISGISAVGAGRIAVDGVNGVAVVITMIQSQGVKRAVNAVIGAQFVVGRDPGCDLAVDDRLMSRRHFQLSCRNGQLMIKDLGSTNKTMVNGAPIQAERPLQSGETVTAGNTKIIISRK